MSENIIKLQDIFKIRRKIYKTVDLRIAAFKHDNNLYNCRSVALFSHKKDTTKLKKLVETKNFTIFSLQTNAQSFIDTLLKTIKTGKFRYHNETVLYTDNFNQSNVNLEYRDYVSGNGEKAKERLGIDWPIDYFIYEWRNNALQNKLSKLRNIIERQIQCHDPPYENMVEAIQSLLNVERWNTTLDNSRFLLIFPTYLKIETCLLDGSKFQVSINFHEKINLTNVYLSLIGKGPKVIRKRLKFDRQPISSKNQSILTAKSQTTLKEISDVQAYLFLKTEDPLSIDIKNVRNKRSQINQKMMAHEIFDTGSEKILQYLQSDQLKDSDNFEWAIATILHFSGFQTEWLHRKVFGEAPDILAFNPEEKIMIVGECTVGVPDENKILKLQERAEQLTSVDLKVRAVLFSKAQEEMLKKVAIPPDITIVNKKQIREMFDLASRGSSPNEIFLQVLKSDAPDMT